MNVFNALLQFQVRLATGGGSRKRYKVIGLVLGLAAVGGAGGGGAHL